MLYHGQEDLDAGADFFGITSSEAEGLFLPVIGRKNTATDVADAVQVLIDEYKLINS